MSHIALYRKYRPTTFSEMVGQEHVTDILRKQIETNKISHAYIFSGTRGTGKTSAAKIFARAINCLNLKDGEPCNECEACRSILSGDSTDVVEMDAASNNSVENIRSIRQEVIYASTQVKYKVYIIDEAHMLSTSAFNALLKTLEEPPEGVIFILATTEEHKILPTILSRCIRFEFKKLSEEQIVARLEKVIADYSIQYEKEALQVIAKLADGALRDALSILERCISNGKDCLTVEVVQEIVGIVQKQIIEELISAVLEYNVIDTNEKVSKILNNGKDLRYCLSQMLETVTDLMIYISGDNTQKINENLVNISNAVGMNRLNYVLKVLSKLDDDLRQTTNSNVIFKAKMLELATEVRLESKEDVIEKIKELELKLEKLEHTESKPQVIIKEVTKEVTSKQEVKFSDSSVAVQNDNQGAKNQKFKMLDKVLKKASDADSPRLYSALSGIQAFESGETLTFITDNSFSYGLLKKDDLKTELKNIVTEISGKDFDILVELQKEEEKPTVSDFEQLLQNTGVPYTKLD